MRRRQLIWLVMGLLVLAVIGRWRYHFAHSGPLSEAAKLQSSLSPAPLQSHESLAPKARSVAAEKSQEVRQFPHRLRNTQEPIGTLLRKDTALLLENAFFDTSLPLEVNIPDSLRARGNPGAYLVQSRHTPDAAFRSALSAAGVNIVSYIPNNAFLVQASTEAAAQLRSSPQIQAVSLSVPARTWSSKEAFSLQ